MITVKIKDPTADGGVAVLRFRGNFDRVPTTQQLVQTKEQAIQYVKEAIGKPILSINGAPRKAHRLLVLKVMEGPLGVSILLDKTVLVGPRPTCQSKVIGRFPIDAKFLLTQIEDCAQNGGTNEPK